VTTILVVCSANQCRSALGGALLQRSLRQAAPEVAVATAGTRAFTGIAATPPTVDAASTLGVDLGAHRSRMVDVAMVDRADLVLTMERAHVREIVVLRPQAFSRTFTLKELVRRGSAVGPRARDQDLSEWLELVHRGRRSTDLLGTSSDDDIEDPTGNRMIDHESIAREIDELLAAAVELIWPESSRRACS
jgi:protein-tyrosine phosphatase